MFSVILSYFLPAFLLAFATVTDGQKVIQASSGDRVVLPCPSLFKYGDKFDVRWEKHGERVLCKYFIEKNNLSIQTCESRFAVSADHTGLIITDVRSSDAGVYNCTMTRLIPPPVEDNSSTLILQVNARLVLQQMNSSSLCVDLLCSLEGLSPEQVNFTWTRESEQLLLENSPTSMSSTLTLCKPNWTDGDVITCQARYSSNHALYSKNVTLECKGCSETSATSWLWILIGTCVGLLFIPLLAVILCKCKKKEDREGSVVYSNKVYENLSFFTSRPNAESSVRINATALPRPNPQGECEKPREECIYEN